MKKQKAGDAPDKVGIDVDLGGILKGLGGLVEKLGELAEAGGELKRTGELRGFGSEKGVRGVYGFTVKTGLGNATTVEPFGNIKPDEASGRPVVHEVMEPAVDIFEEADHTLVVAELPGIGFEDVQLDVTDDVLTIAAARGPKKYRKEVVLPAVFPREKMKVSCTNGILEIRCVR